MTIDLANKIFGLIKEKEAAEDKIRFFSQFLSSHKQVYFTFWEAKPPKLEITTITDDGSWFVADDETIRFLIKSYEVKRDRLIEEIDAV